ncbi:hypothetical protein M409DRAFT_61086 [Zasmidium cellare ATCC 36951]|uniref:Apple domain-containing protein n=1 Tax=Zasmidium cellare ATCC 36951 TaxID=1080233 RepID=A0A6A6BWC2_ZASCE|nr:uncharacterized protein M409DRAFT_61086 [Zasmidium cellare ATCC 36951]KAF2159134.1 hypothetical protein M409DRAFT_61086 [Zasmidium cellare ATCC 36951]
MIVPNLSKTLKPSREDIAPDPTPEPTATGTPRLIPINASEIPRRRRRADKSSVLSRVFGSPERSTPFTTVSNQGLAGRQSCASGLTYYSCANGFTGCCQGNPCTQTAQCSVEDPITSTGSGTSTTQSRTSTAQSSRTGTATANNSGTRTATGTATTRTGTGTGTAAITTANGTPTGTATSTGLTTTLSTPNATPAPNCPGAPSNYTDDSGIAYQVKCNIDNGGPFNQTIKVDAGGYAQCCSACSSSRECVGFTFFGENGNSTDAGNCYVRSSMQTSEDFNSNSYVVALYKVDPSAVATTTPVPSSSGAANPSQSSGSNIGAIAGGVVGGVAALGLLLFLAFFLIRRQRKKVDARHAAEKKAPTLPTTNPRYHDGVIGGHSTHHRSGSTANDIYAPQGGGGFDHHHSSYPSNGDYALQPMVTGDKRADHFSELEGHSSTPPGLRAEGGRGKRIPAGTLRPPQMLDSRAAGGVGGAGAASRSSVFLEHMSEMEDTSQGRPTTTSVTSPYSFKAGESPTLGHPAGSTTSLADETRRRQHLLYWNNYDSGQLNDQEGRGQMSATMVPKTPPSAARTAPQISPDNSGAARDSSFVVSPLRGRKSDQDGGNTSDPSIGPRRGTS